MSEVGTVLSLPGCEDQAVHADTPHLYEHMQLPPHYVNLFLPAVSSDAQCDASVGQTAWVTGTHKLAVAARLMGALLCRVCVLYCIYVIGDVALVFLLALLLNTFSLSLSPLSPLSPCGLGRDGTSGSTSLR